MPLKSGRALTIFLSISIFILLPFIYSPNLQDVEQSPRFLFLAGIVALSSLFSLITIVKNPYILTQSSFIHIFLLFIFLLVVSFARSINFGDGLFELLKLLLLLSLFFHFALVLKADEFNKRIFLKVICISALIFIVFGFLQILPGLMEEGKLTIRYNVSSTLGNKNFFSETLVMMLPLTMLSIALFNSYWRIIAIISTVLILISLILLQTMAAWVAVIVSIALVVALLFQFHKKLFSIPGFQRISRIVIVVIILFTAVSGFLFYKLAGTDQIVSKIHAFKELIDPDATHHHLKYQNSIYERAWMWRNSFKMMKEHTFFGTGLANWKIYYPKYGLGSATYMTSDAIRFVHPHNDFILVACEMGLMGLLIFIAMIVVLFYYCWVVIKNAEQSKVFIGAALFFGVLAYIIISLFSMPLYRLYPPLLFVFFTSLIYSEYAKVTVTRKVFTIKSAIAIFSVSFLIGVFSIVIGYKRLSADYNLSAALLNERNNNWNAMQRHLDRIDKKVFPLDVTATPIAWYQGFAFFYFGDIDKAHELFKEAELVNPYHLKVLNDVGSCYNLKGDVKKAKKYFFKALEIQPAFNDAIVNLAIVYFNEGKIDSSYSTLIRHSGIIKRESVNVFSTIIQAKAQTITSDFETLERLKTQTANHTALTTLLKQLKAGNRGIYDVLEVE